MSMLVRCTHERWEAHFRTERSVWRRFVMNPAAIGLTSKEVSGAALPGYMVMPKIK
jgi:hypothetical protein